MAEGNSPREVTVWMWACDTHGTQPVHYQARGSWVRTCRTCGERLYQTLKWVPAAGIQRIETKPVQVTRITGLQNPAITYPEPTATKGL